MRLDTLYSCGLLSGPIGPGLYVLSNWTFWYFRAYFWGSRV